MSGSVVRRQAVGAVVAFVAIAATIPAGTASGAAVARQPAGDRVSESQSVTVQLASPRPEALTALAGAAGLSADVRSDRLDDVLPTDAQHTRVRSELAARGLTVTGETAWSITAEGAASDVDAAATSTGALGDDVGSVIRSSDGPPLVHPLSTPLSGPALQEVYATTASGPQPGKARLTVATLQFSGWDKSALTTYATNNGFDSPITSGRYSEVGIDGASTTAYDGMGGEQEVALDQEALLAVAPEVDQRVYVANNEIEGFVLGVERVATEAAAGTRHIAALSISWGACEDYWSSRDLTAMHAAFQHAVAAGVTIFAASGDNGAYDCPGSSGKTVGYPASEPYVVAVGGTVVTSTGPTAEAGWSGSGGGSSRYFARPRYQHRAAPSATKRQVPDISSLAGSPGFRIWYGTGGSKIGVVGGTSLASPIAAGLLAAALEVRGHESGLGSIHARLYDARTGLRDIVSGTNGFSAKPGYDNVTGRGSPLWDALAPVLDTAPTISSASYSNSRTIPVTVSVPTGAAYVGWRSGIGAAPSCTGVTTSTSRPTGFTLAADGAAAVWVQGVTTAAKCYTATALLTADTVRPVARATVKLTKATKSGRVTVAWTAGDGGKASGVKTATVTITRAGRSQPVAVVRTTGSGTRVIDAVQGKTYRARVVITDRAGNVSKAATAKAAVPLDDSRFTLRGTWKRSASSGAFGGAWRGSSTAGSSASLKATGSTYRLLMTTCVSCGKAAIYLGGKRVATVDLFSRTTRHRVSVKVGTRTFGAHTVRVVTLGKSRADSYGDAVRIDALVASR